MIMYVIAIRDRAADVYGQPIFVANLGGAIRSFGDEVNNPESNIAKHPEDFDLFEIGSYDDSTAQLVSILPRQLAVGKDLVRK